MSLNDYLQQKAVGYKQALLSKYPEELIISNEQKWIFQNLSILYEKADVLDTKIIINPYIEIIYIETEEVEEDYIFMPKYWSAQELIIYHSPLTDINLFLKSIANYGVALTGEELIKMIHENNSSIDIVRLRLRLNTIFRKFLSYQFTIVDV